MPEKVWKVGDGLVNKAEQVEDPKFLAMTAQIEVMNEKFNDMANKLVDNSSEEGKKS